MKFVLMLLPGLMILIAVVGAVKIMGRSREMRRAWTSGLTAEARCLRTYTTTSGGGGSGLHTSLHHVYEFCTWDGRVIRFDEVNGPGTRVEGDIVTVYYAPERPEKATAHAPNHVKNTLGTGVGLGCMGVIAVLALVFILVLLALPI